MSNTEEIPLHAVTRRLHESFGNLSIAWLVGFASGVTVCLVVFVAHRQLRRCSQQEIPEEHDISKAKHATLNVIVGQTHIASDKSTATLCADQGISLELPKIANKVLHDDESSTRTSDLDDGEVSGGSLDISSILFRCATDDLESGSLEHEATDWELGEDSSLPGTPPTVQEKLADARRDMGFEGDIEELANRFFEEIPRRVPPTPQTIVSVSENLAAELRAHRLNRVEAVGVSATLDEELLGCVGRPKPVPQTNPTKSGKLMQHRASRGLPAPPNPNLVEARNANLAKLAEARKAKSLKGGVEKSNDAPQPSPVEPRGDHHVSLPRLCKSQLKKSVDARRPDPVEVRGYHPAVFPPSCKGHLKRSEDAPKPSPVVITGSPEGSPRNRNHLDSPAGYTTL